MTKLKNLFAVVLLLGFAACKTETIDPDVVGKPVETNPNAAVNSWIYDEMTSYYLWTANLPAKTSTNAVQTPDKYFGSILNQPGEVDRFSWIQESSEALTNSLNGKNTSLGIKTSAFYADAEKKNIAFAIAYVLKDSPADKAGIKRGDFITKVNGNILTLDNYGSALTPENLNLTMGDYVGTNIVSNNKTINVVKTEVQTNPVQHYSIINKGTKKIGYLVYTQYLSQYDDDLRRIFGEFKAAGVNELVLDLRYNGGGFISSATTLSSLIGKDVSASKVCYTDEWNANITKQYKDRFGANYFTKYFKNETNNIGSMINRLYVLTSRSTASASELTINNLLPYMPVIRIGDNTYGKNVGSITIDDDQKRWKWGMQPVVLRTANASGDSNYGGKDGFAPTVRVVDNRLPFKEFGDSDETLLAAAIAQITGQTLATSANLRIKPSEKVTPFSRSDNPIENRYEMFAEPLPNM